MPFAEPEPEPQPCPGPDTTGLSRRRFLAGLGAVGVSVLGSQVVSTRVAYGATAANPNTVIVMFLRGGADGLRILSPHSAALGLGYLRNVRTSLVPGESEVIGLDGTGGWALNKAMAPLHQLLWSSGEMAFVPAVSNPGLTRSHFQAMQFLEQGGNTTEGWLDRVLAQLGPGTAFQAVAQSAAVPMSLAGPQPKLAMSSLANFNFPAAEWVKAPSIAAVSALYKGVSGPLGQDVPIALGAVSTVASIRTSAGVQNGAVYPEGPTGSALRDLAAILRAEAGLQVATLDVSSWDTHTDEARGLDALLDNTAAALTAFFTDLGAARRSRVTVIVVSEFGRRVAMNASGGTDHGHGSLVWLLGGGVVGKAVHGRWTPLTKDTDLDAGDVPGLNDVFSILGEVAQKRLNLGSLSSVFPGQTYAPLGVARTG